MAKTLKGLALTLLSLPLLAGCGATATPFAVNQAEQMSALRAKRGPLQLIVMPDMGMKPILSAITGAKKSVQLEIYMFTDHDESAQLVQALVERAKAGVNVQVLIDPHPYIPPSAPDCKPVNVSPNQETIQALVAGGVRVSYSSPRFKFTHEKSMLVDGSTAYIMTLNLTNSAFTTNREYALVDRTPEDVNELSRIFQADWSGGSYTPSAGTRLVVSPNNSRQQLLGLIDSASKTLIIQTEFLSDPEVAAHLSARVKAGVDVTVELAYQEKNPCMPGDVMAEETQLMQQNGIAKFGFMQNVKMHAKTVMADGARAFLGSENFTTNSLNGNREVGILIDDPAIVTQMVKIASSDWVKK